MAPKKEASAASLDATPSRIPASVHTNTPMIDSYTFHSSDEEAQDPDAEYIMGIDEAGRGPVLGSWLQRGRTPLNLILLLFKGPQVYAVAFCKASYEEELKQMGFAGQSTCNLCTFSGQMLTFQENRQQNPDSRTARAPARCHCGSTERPQMERQGDVATRHLQTHVAEVTLQSVCKF